MAKNFEIFHNLLREMTLGLVKRSLLKLKLWTERSKKSYKYQK